MAQAVFLEGSLADITDFRAYADLLYGGLPFYSWDGLAGNYRNLSLTMWVVFFALLATLLGLMVALERLDLGHHRRRNARLAEPLKARNERTR